MLKKLFLLKIVKILYKAIYKKDSVTFWIDRFLPKDSTMVVQIGSNDGRTGDPLYQLIKKNKFWKALFVEPVPFVYERLKQNYSNDSRFLFENSAINAGENQDFYWVDSSAKDHIKDLPAWYDQLNSFDKRHILKHLNGSLEPFIKSVKVSGLSMNQLLDKYRLKMIDLLHVDTEGYDWKIISQIDFNKITPTIILFEHAHLTENEKSLSINHLSDKYFIFRFKGDYLCLKRDSNKIQQILIKELKKRKSELNNYSTNLSL